MRTQTSALILVTAFASLVAGCNGTVDGGGGAGEESLSTPKNHSFLPFQSWGASFTAQQGWGTADTPVLFGKINDDTRDDFIGFGNAGVYVGYSNATSFGSVFFALAEFGTSQGWSAAKHVRLVGDINNDGRDDIVAFGDAGVWTALSNGSGFAAARFVRADLGYNQGWRVDKHVRMLADVNGDHFKDIVAYGDAGVYVSFGDGAGGFGVPQFLVANFGAQQGWSNTSHIRTAVDLNNDGRDDLVAFGNDGVWTALSAGTWFAAPRYVLADFGVNQGWTVASNPRSFVDMDGDGNKDIVGIGAAGVYTARSNVDGSFGVNRFVHAADCVTRNGRSCIVADLNGDSYGDFLAYSYNEFNQSLGPSLAFETRVLYGVGAKRFATADVDGNGLADLVVFNDAAIEVARSSVVVLPPAPLTVPAVTWVDSATPSSLTFHWTDSSSNETGFEIQYYSDPNSVYQTQSPAPANSTSTVFHGLDSTTKYCYRIRAINNFTYSSWTGFACGKTQDANAPTSGTSTMYLNEDPPPVTGVVSYSGTWNPAGKSINRISSSYNNGDRILFVKPGPYVPADVCYTTPTDVVSLYSLGSLTAAEVASIEWHNSDGSISFHACLGQAMSSSTVVPSLVFNYDWQQ